MYQHFIDVRGEILHHFENNLLNHVLLNLDLSFFENTVDLNQLGSDENI